MSSGAELSQSSNASAPRVRVVVGASLSQRAAAEIPVRAALGAAASSSSSQSSASAAASVVPPSNAASQLPFATKTTLFDLCDSSYMKKKVKRQRKDKSAGGAAAAAASSSSASARPAQKLSQRRLPPPVEEARGIGPQVELVNGNIVLKESSLVMPDPAGDEEDYDDVSNNAGGGAGGAAGGGTQKPATYNSFLKRKSGSRWGVEETWLFYKALRQCGTEFSLMQSFFPGRTRKQLKQKFIKEEREHPELVRRTLDHSTPLELEPFRAQFGALQGKEAKAASKEAAREEDTFVPSLSSSSSSSSSRAAAAAVAVDDEDDEEDDNDDDGEGSSAVGKKRAAPDADAADEEEEEEDDGLFDV